MVKNPPASTGDSGLIPGSGRSPGGGHSYPLQYSCLENSIERGAWQATVHAVAESDTAEGLTLSLFFHMFRGDRDINHPDLSTQGT